jgi:hypothetical protein
MYGGAIVFFIVVLVVSLLINAFAATALMEIAEMKGHKDRKYFWWTFWIPMFGIAMIIALPDRGSNAKSVSTQNDDLPEI